MTNRSALFLVNPNSRRGRETLPQARLLLHEAQDLDLIEPNNTGPDVSETIRRHRDGVSLVIVGGGDGSLNGAAAGLMETGLPLAVLPLGTANDFARTMGIPLDLASAVDVLTRNESTPVDLGAANGHLFFNVASIGFSADLAASLPQEAKKRWGKLGYGIVAARLLKSSRVFSQRISTMMAGPRNSRRFRSRSATGASMAAA